MDYNILKFYSRRDIQKEIIKLAKDREIAVKYRDKGFGKRPDILQYSNDILELAKKGVTSFHVSEERWNDPLELSTGMTINQLNLLRKGWDLLLDLDTKNFEYGKIAAYLLIEALKFNGVKNIGCKFSGGSGFHILVPFESFPSVVDNKNVVNLFPDGARTIASYLKNMMKDYLKEEILKFHSLDEISKITGKKIAELKEKNVFNPFSVVDVDPILISSRHMFRSIYSVNEKTGLISVPVDIKKIKKFDIGKAKIENVEVEDTFFDFKHEKDASQLFVQAFDWSSRNEIKEVKVNRFRQYDSLKVAIKDDNFFPPCMKAILKGIKEDGRKRSIFVLINFLKKLGWNLENIEKELLKWNKKNYEPLREGYIIAQIKWHKRQKEDILPPNCKNESYYKGMAVCNPDNLCNLINNPVQYVSKKVNLLKKNKRKDSSK